MEDNVIEIINTINKLDSRIKRYESIKDTLLSNEDMDILSIVKFKTKRCMDEIDKYKHHESENVRLRVYETGQYSWTEFANDESSLIKLKLMSEKFLKTSWLCDKDKMVSEYAKHLFGFMNERGISLAEAVGYGIAIDDINYNSLVA